MAGRRNRLCLPGLGAALALGGTALPAVAQEAVDARVEALERQMAEMRRGFEAQMQALEREIETLRGAAGLPPPPTEPPAQVVGTGREEQPEETTRQTEAATEPVVSSGQPKIKLSVSGQINRAVNVADDGDRTKAYFVDSDVSNSRVRLLGTAEVNEDVRFGAQLETAFSPNNSFDVSQTDEETDDFIDVRRAEAAVDSKRFGRLWLGKGSSATDDIAEYDLSGVDVIMYSGVSDIVGGLFFTDEDGELTDLTVGSAFFNFDGGRQNRMRYDTPTFGPGLQLSASTGSDQRYDVALNLGGDFGAWPGVTIGPFTTLGAIGIGDPSESGVDYRMAGSASILHDASGFNLTLSGGMDEADGRDPYNLYIKGGWYGTLNTLGNTGFGIDATRSHEVAAAGDTGYSVGGAVVQTIEGYGTELYGQARWFTLDRDEAPSVEDVVVGTIGTRVKF